MKKIISIFLAVIMCFSNHSHITLAKENVSEYNAEDTEAIYKKYVYNEEMFEVLFNTDKTVYYWRMINNIEKDHTLKWSIDVASQLIGEIPDKKKYAEILSNLILMQSGDLIEQIEQQYRIEGFREGGRYAKNIIDIAKNFIGGAEILNSIGPIIDAATGGVDVLIENKEQVQYYETTIRDYSQSKLFLEAVADYSSNDDLKSVASLLLDANDKLLEKRLEYIADSTETLANFEAQFFLENLSFELLKKTDIYSTDDTVKWFVDCGSNLASSLLSMKAAGEFAFHMTMLAGDIGFGTTNTFNRYQEMKVVADIASSIVEANSRITIPLQHNELDTMNRIRTKCDYYRMLITTHARGEYLIFQLLIKDAGLLSQFRALFDSFKEPDETTEGLYNRQIDVMLEYIQILDNMFRGKMKDNINKDIRLPRNAVEYNGHYYYVYELSEVTSWKEAKEYCESQGGYLATITSKEEDEFVFSYLQNNFEYESAYLGLTDRDEEGTWIWDNGEEVSYMNWHSGEPNGENSNEDFAMYYYKYSDGSWNDGDFGELTANSGKAFICEWENYTTTENNIQEEFVEDQLFGSWLQMNSDDPIMLTLNEDSTMQYYNTVSHESDYNSTFEWKDRLYLNLLNLMDSNVTTVPYKVEICDGQNPLQMTLTLENAQTSSDMTPLCGMEKIMVGTYEKLNFSKEQLETIKTTLGVPKDMDVVIVQSPPYYWEEGQSWLTHVVIYDKSNHHLAEATFYSKTAELCRGMIKYAG